MAAIVNRANKAIYLTTGDGAAVAAVEALK